MKSRHQAGAGPTGQSLARKGLTQPSLDTYPTPRVFEVQMSGGGTIRAYEVGPSDAPLVVGIHGTPSTGLGHIVDYLACGAVSVAWSPSIGKAMEGRRPNLAVRLAILPQ
ncbi:hypothetical protein MesoLj131a_62650 [Mesorhizobium sp. 131-2-1]|nr:hypothetical protein MesoLj131a_62650 [Mesorhizobium sp. 131-2-1]BCH04472.1 hypothetical protein MesoLj131b_64710 [Mesorhizobium sp. 131-2-5]